ncbi:MAG: hypothetical protein ACUVQ8_01125 [Nitrososphaeria archaeon]
MKEYTVKVKEPVYVALKEICEETGNESIAQTVGMLVAYYRVLRQGSQDLKEEILREISG